MYTMFIPKSNHPAAQWNYIKGHNLSASDLRQGWYIQCSWLISHPYSASQVEQLDNKLLLKKNKKKMEWKYMEKQTKNKSILDGGANTWPQVMSPTQKRYPCPLWYHHLRPRFWTVWANGIKGGLVSFQGRFWISEEHRLELENTGRVIFAMDTHNLFISVITAALNGN